MKIIIQRAGFLKKNVFICFITNEMFDLPDNRVTKRLKINKYIV